MKVGAGVKLVVVKVAVLKSINGAGEGIVVSSEETLAAEGVAAAAKAATGRLQGSNRCRSKV